LYQNGWTDRAGFRHHGGFLRPVAHCACVSWKRSSGTRGNEGYLDGWSECGILWRFCSGAAAGLLLWARRARHIDRLLHVRRSAASARACMHAYRYRWLGGGVPRGCGSHRHSLPPSFIHPSPFLLRASVAEWLACWTQAQKGPGSNRSRDAVA